MNKLETLASVLSSISGSPSVYALEKPGDVDTCIVYRQIDSSPTRGMSGSNLFEKSRIQLDVYSPAFSDNRSLVDLVKSRLDLNITDFKIAYLINDFPVKDIESDLYRTILEFEVW